MSKRKEPPKERELPDVRGGSGRERSSRHRNHPSRASPPLPRERLPRAILPDHGFVKPRPILTRLRVSLFRYSPHDDRSRTAPEQATRPVGSAYYKGEWRKYDHVTFKGGVHYLRIVLTERERQVLECSGDATRYGWATFELIDRNPSIPRGKDYFKSQFFVYRKPVVLIGLFDGIGGARVAMEKLEDRYTIVRSFSSETDKTARAVVKRNFPDTVELGDVGGIDRRSIARRILGDPEVDRIRRGATWDDEVHFIVVAGPPCQNLSQAKAVNGRTEGVLDGEKSRMFFHVPRIMKYLADALKQVVRGELAKKKILHFLVENVEMSNRDRTVFSEFLGGVEPWKVDLNEGGCCASLMSRRRLYWCSLMPEGKEVGLEAFKRSCCAHPALAEGKGLEDVLAQHGLEGYEFCSKNTDRRVERLPTMTRHIENKGQEKYFVRRRGEEQTNRAPEDINEDLLGFPVGHTHFGIGSKRLTEKSRRLLLGNSFMIFHIKYFLRRMHSFTDLVLCENEPVASAPMLPQDRCRQRIDLGSKKSKMYQNILSVLTCELRFDELEEGRKGPMLDYLGKKD